MNNNKFIQHFKTFDELFEDTQKKVIEFGITSRTVLREQKEGFKQLKPIMEAHDVLFSWELALNWLQENFQYGVGTYYYNWRLINLLEDNLHGRLTEWKAYILDKNPLSTQAYITLLDDYIQFLKDFGYRKATINFKKGSAKWLLLFLEKEGILSLEDWDHKTIAKYTHSEHFMNRKPDGVKGELCRLRHFLDYLFDKELIARKLSEAVLTYSVSQQRIVTTMSKESQEILLQSIERFQTPKRDKAIVLLALRCGLRGGDILHLKFENIDLRARRVCILQSKTGGPVNRLIPNDALEALIDYVRDERPESDSPYIFLRSQGPAKPLSGPFSTKKFFMAADKSLQPDEYGLHILRRTNGSELAKAGLEIHKVGKALGHTTMSNVDKYLSTDEEKMKACALEVGPFDYKGDLF